MSKTREKKYNIEIGSIWHSNSCGDFIILENLGLKDGASGTYKTTHYLVRYLVSGTVHELTRHQVVYGDFKDPYYPSKYGVGYLGEMAGKIDSDPLAHKAYVVWDAMLSRCYNPNNKKDYPIYGARGVRVDPAWFNFTVFFYDIQDLIGFNEWKNSYDYALDKDVSQYGEPNKIYSKANCRFILKSENTKIRHLESGKLPPSGFHGVVSDRNVYRAQMTIKGKTVGFGSFDKPQYAARVYNYYANIYNRIENNNLDVSLYEALNHRILPKGQQLKEMCKIVDKNK